MSKAISKFSTLVIGGTGMLAEASSWLGDRSAGLTMLNRKYPDPSGKFPLATHLTCDYTDTPSLQKSLATCSTFDLVVAWIHGDATKVLKSVFDHQQNASWQLLHVLSSATDAAALSSQLNPPDACSYLTVQLGFKIEAGSSRWLTHNEISGGVITAISERKSILVGQIEPWDSRP